VPSATFMAGRQALNMNRISERPKKKPWRTDRGKDKEEQKGDPDKPHRDNKAVKKGKVDQEVVVKEDLDEEGNKRKGIFIENTNLNAN